MKSTKEELYKKEREEIMLKILKIIYIYNINGNDKERI